MEDSSRLDIEKELAAQLERELAARQKQPSADADKAATDSSPVTKGRTDADDAKRETRAELEAELQKQLDAELKNRQEKKEPEDLRQQLEAELEKELSASLGGNSVDDDKSGADGEGGKPVAATEPENGEKSTEKGKTAEGAGAGKDKNKTGNKEDEGKPGVDKRLKGKGLRGKAAKGRTKSTKQLTEQDLKIIEEKAKIDARFKKLKYIVYPLITVCSLPIAIIILTQCGKERPSTSGKERVTYKQSGRTVDLGSNNRSGPREIPAAQREIQVVDMRSLQLEVARLRGLQKFQRAIDKIQEYKGSRSEDANKCRSLADDIVKDFVSSPNVGSDEWRNVKSQAQLFGQSSNAGEIQQAIDLLCRFWNDNPDERFAADYFIKLYTARYLEIANNMPVDNRRFD